MTDSEDYVYEVINNEADALVCAHLLAKEFTKGEPMTNFARIGEQVFLEQAMWPLVKDSLENELSILVRHRSTNEIVAAIVANDLYSDHKKHPYNPSDPPHIFAVVDFMSEMDQHFIERDFGQELKPLMVLHIFVGATREDHARKGIASRLRRFLCDYARKSKGFQYALVQPTNPATRHIYANKMGGKVVTEVDPTTWLWTKKDDGTSCPYREFKGGIVSNVLIKLT